LQKINEVIKLAGVFFQRREVVVPGQLLAEGRYRGAIGTYRDEERIYSALVGLAELRGNTVRVVPLEGVYIPREGDLVIGTITEVASNNWKVDIGGPYGASIHANNALRRPYDDDLSRYMNIGDVIAAEISTFDRVTGPYLSMKGRGLRKLDGGMVLEVSPAKIPRIIGRRGSMINMIKDILRIRTIVGQNGRIWIRAPNIPILRLAIRAFRTIEEKSHTLKLTDRIQTMLQEEVAKLKGEKKTPEESPEEDNDKPADEETKEEKTEENSEEEKQIEEEKEVKE
jgi:exosome complex component RRP4